MRELRILVIAHLAIQVSNLLLYLSNADSTPLVRFINLLGVYLFENIPQSFQFLLPVVIVTIIIFQISLYEEISDYFELIKVNMEHVFQSLAFLIIGILLIGFTRESFPFIYIFVGIPFYAYLFQLAETNWKSNVDGLERHFKSALKLVVIVSILIPIYYVVRVVLFLGGEQYYFTISIILPLLTVLVYYNLHLKFVPILKQYENLTDYLEP